VRLNRRYLVTDGRAAPGESQRIVTPRRNGPGPYVRGAHGIKNPTAEQIADYIASHAVPAGYNRHARRRQAWMQRTQAGRRELAAIEAARKLNVPLPDEVAV